MSNEFFKKTDIKKSAPISLVIAALLSACGAKEQKPNIAIQIDTCDAVRIFELAPGDRVNFIDTPQPLDFQIDENGFINPPDNEHFGVNNPGASWWFGDKNTGGTWYDVLGIQDTNNNGLMETWIQKKCPVEPTSMNQAPIRSGRLASLPPGFNPSRGSKPARG